MIGILLLVTFIDTVYCFLNGNLSCKQLHFDLLQIKLLVMIIIIIVDYCRSKTKDRYVAFLFYRFYSEM